MDTREAKLVRLPPELWRLVGARAQENRRSTTKEIEHALAERYAAPTQPQPRE